MTDRLDLYESGHHEPLGHVARDGTVHLPDRHPVILFADVPVILHLSAGITVGPLDEDAEGGGP